MARLTHSVSVGALVQRTMRSGDIHFRFSTRSNAADGIKGHQKLQKSRGEGYLAEQTIKDLIEFDTFDLQLSGRADGCWPDQDNFVVEEIKTVKVKVERIPEPVARLHWAQVSVYGYLLAIQHEVEQVTLRLTYYNLDDKTEHSVDDVRSRAELGELYHEMTQSYGAFIARNRDWLRTRNQTIESLPMPFGDFRPGQRQMAVSVYRALSGESQLVLQAPTGIGKTMATLFPAVKALENLSYDRVFYLSAKGSGQAMARAALNHMRDAGLKLRDVTITAKDKICFNPGMPCDPQYCQYAKSYFDKLPRVISTAQSSELSFDRDAVEDLARSHQMCPFELGLDLSEVADVVIGDYNYVFDPNVYLKRHFDEPDKYALLIDESHNLVDRGRDMFSASLDKKAVLELKKLIPDYQQALKRSVNGLNKALLSASRDVEGEQHLESLPASLDRALGRFIQAAEVVLEEQWGSEYQRELLELYFAALRFSRVGEQADQHYALVVFKSKATCVFKWFCLNPASRLAEGFGRLTSSICFSATLSPGPYYQTLLGLSDDSKWYQLPSPFDPQKLGVFATTYLSTTYHNRENSLYDLVDTIAAAVASRKGNYIVYFPSYAYLNLAYEKFSERYPNQRTICQQSQMTDEDKAEFLTAFDQIDGALVGFAVAGGAFGEGVDLTGQRLIGVVIVGVGLPQLSLERNLIRDYFDQEGMGFEYAYQFPGMIRVLQTAGRVIRTEHDKGIVCLIDHRFNELSYRQLFPNDWRVEQVKNVHQLAQNLERFWHSSDGSEPG